MQYGRFYRFVMSNLSSMYCAEPNTTCQGFKFPHRNLVTLCDVGADNILINFAEGWLAPDNDFTNRPMPFCGRKGLISCIII
jgi:hypothetical protein